MERPGADNPARARTPSRTVAVVLCAAGEPPPRALLDALARRKVEAVLAGDPYRAIRALASSTDPARTPPALIVVEPALHRAGSAGDLLHSVRRRFPGVALWRYDRHARPPLRAMSSATFSDDAPPAASNQRSANGRADSAVQPSNGRPSSPTPLRLTGADEPRPQDAPPSALLSEEELTMLLSDDLDPPASR